MKSEHTKAKAWREQLGLSVQQLADLTGYSAKSLYWFEQGLTPPLRRAKSGRSKDRAIDPQVWKRYKTNCAGVAAQLFHKQNFNW